MTRCESARTQVIHVASEIVERAEPFQDIMDDVATLRALGALFGSTYVIVFFFCQTGS